MHARTLYQATCIDDLEYGDRIVLTTHSLNAIYGIFHEYHKVNGGWYLTITPDGCFRRDVAFDLIAGIENQ